MSSETKFNFGMDGLEELENDLKKAVKKCPAQVEDTLVDIAKDFKASAKKRANSELKTHKREDSQKKKAIKAKWGHQLVAEGMSATALVWNSARHFHLIEDGHNIVTHDGKNVGWVEGKYIMEKTRNEYKDIIPERFEEMIDDILKECDLN